MRANTGRETKAHDPEVDRAEPDRTPSLIVPNHHSYLLSKRGELDKCQALLDKAVAHVPRTDESRRGEADVHRGQPVLSTEHTNPGQRDCREDGKGSATSLVRSFGHLGPEGAQDKLLRRA